MFCVKVMQNSQQLVQNLIILEKSLKHNIVYGNEKLDSISGQIIAPENSL